MGASRAFRAGRSGRVVVDERRTRGPSLSVAVPERPSGAVLPCNDEPVGLRELTDLLLATPSFEDYAQRLVEIASERIIPGAVCGLTMVMDAKPRTIASSGNLANRVDEIQYSNGDGPCLESLRTSTVIVVVDLTREDRWGTYREHAIEQGVRSSLSLPILNARASAAGALNLYFTEPTHYTHDQIQLGQHFADQAAGALQLATRLAQQATLTDQLREAMTSRSVIDQAIGILMAQNRCTPQTAFDLLRRASQARNVKLRTLATDIVRAVGS